MTKFEAPSFSVGVGDNQAYRDNWERIFGKKEEKPDPWANEREATPKEMSDLPPPRAAQDAPVIVAPTPKKPKKPKKVKAKNGKTKKKQKKTKK